MLACKVPPTELPACKMAIAPKGISDQLKDMIVSSEVQATGKSCWERNRAWSIW